MEKTIECNLGRESCKYEICSFSFCASHFCFRGSRSLAIPCAAFVSHPKNPCQQAGISVSTAWVPAFRRLLPAAQHEKLAERSRGYLGWHGAFQRNTSWAFSLYVPFHSAAQRNCAYMEERRDLTQQCCNYAKHPLTWELYRNKLAGGCADKGKICRSKPLY